MEFKQQFIVLFLLITVKFCSGEQNGGKSREKVFGRISKAVSSFGANVLFNFHVNSKSNENILISPINIYQALCLIHLAAGGKTLEELSSVLGIPSARNYSKTSLHSAIGSYYSKAAETGSHSVTLEMADALFIQNGFKIKPAFYDQMRKFYDSKVENVNFKAGKVTSDKINGWVADKTKGRIPIVVDENFDPATVAMIITTLYFNGSWADSFVKEATKTEKFFNGEKEIDVPMMNLIKRAPYVNNTTLKFEAVDLHFEGFKYSMNIILPYPTQTIKDTMENLKGMSIKEIMKKPSYDGVDVKLPKVKFSKKVSLVEPLQKLGVQEIFSVANLTDMTDSKVAISEIFHNTEIEIREEGTTATAVTVAEIFLTSLPEPIVNPAKFYVNRPFIMNIYNQEEDMVLFTGIIYKP